MKRVRYADACRNLVRNLIGKIRLESPRRREEIDDGMRGVCTTNWGEDISGKARRKEITWKTKT
jgi:hypothetical protein